MIRLRSTVLILSTIIFLFLAASLLFRGPAYLPAPLKPSLSQPPSPPPPPPPEHSHFPAKPAAAPASEELESSTGEHGSDAPKPNAPPPDPPTHDTSTDDAPPSPQVPLKVTITETGGSHDEVIAALVHSFASQPNTEISLYQLLARYKITGIMSAFSDLPSKVPGPRVPGAFKTEGMTKHRPDIYVAGTCEIDLKFFKKEIQALLDDGKTYLICVIHHADRWSSEDLEVMITPWVASGRIEFWTLSPHTRTFMTDRAVAGWNTTLDGHSSLVRYFVPVFPVQLPDLSTVGDDLSFGIQGDYSSGRRNYKKIFTQLSSFVSTSSDANITMHLLGHGSHPTVPPALVPHVKFDENLNYDAYYETVSRTFALVPAFANDEYLDRKASSSVPASLIGGAPLVATKSIVDAYSYLTEEDVWLQGDEESDLDVVSRILDMKPQERREKKELVRRRCAEIIEENAKLVGEWVGRAMDVVRKLPKEEEGVEKRAWR